MTGLFCIIFSSALKAFILYTLWNACIVAAGLALMSYILVISGMLRKVFFFLKNVKKFISLIKPLYILA